MNYILFLLFVILQFLDFWTTYNVIKSGKGHEGNMIVQYLIDKLGIIKAFLFIKIAAIIGIYYVQLTHFYYDGVDLVTVLMITINTLYFFVVYENYLIYKKD